MEEDAENAENAEENLPGDYRAQRRIETEYQIVEAQPAVISFSEMPTGRSDIRIGLPRRTTLGLRVSRSHCTMLTNSSGDPAPAGSSIIPTPAGPIPVAIQHVQLAGCQLIRSRRNNAVRIELTTQNKACELIWDWMLFVNPFPDPITVTEKVHQCWSDAWRILGLPNFPDAASH